MSAGVIKQSFTFLADFIAVFIIFRIVVITDIFTYYTGVIFKGVWFAYKRAVGTLVSKVKAMVALVITVSTKAV